MGGQGENDQPRRKSLQPNLFVFPAKNEGKLEGQTSIFGRLPRVPGRGHPRKLIRIERRGFAKSTHAGDCERAPGPARSRHP